jgi:phosphoglycerate dehydrogenase-like enzyme
VATAHAVRDTGHLGRCHPTRAQAVAEYALVLAIDPARGISREDRAFRGGRERWVSAGVADSILLRGADIGFVGFGSIGRALQPLLVPFAPVLRAYDPWLPDSVLRERGLIAGALNEVVARSTFLFVLATVTPESERSLDARSLGLVPAGARLVFVSRAAIVDEGALLERVAAERFLAEMRWHPA